MPRRSRLQAAGLPVHIIQRGNNRQACFFAEDDYLFFLDHLARIAKRVRCALHAYVLMTNHFHLLLTPELPAGPSLLMKCLGQRYVQYANRTYKRSGSLWEGRFRSSLVQTAHYVLGCYRARFACRRMAAMRSAAAASAKTSKRRSSGAQRHAGRGDQQIVWPSPDRTTATH